MLRGFLIATVVWSAGFLALLSTGMHKPKKPKPKVVQLSPAVLTATTRETRRRTVSAGGGGGGGSYSVQAAPAYQPLLQPNIIVQYPQQAVSNDPGKPPTCEEGTQAKVVKTDGKNAWQCVKDTTKPSKPGNPAATAGNAKVQLTWSASSDVGGIKQYLIYRDGTLLGNTSNTSYVDSTVQNDTEYSYQIAAEDKAGNKSAKTAAVKATPSAASEGPDTLPPGVPINLVATPTKEVPKVELTWTEPIDNVGISYYRVYREGELLGTSTAATYTDLTVSRASEYHYEVLAVDAAGNLSDKTPRVSTYVS